MKMTKASFLKLTSILCIVLFTQACSKKSDESVHQNTSLSSSALELHDRILTLDSHADTPLRLIEPGFDLAERHDPHETGSKLDYPRMIEGGLDAVFFAAFVAQGIRDDDGHTRARELALQMLDAVWASAEKNSDIVGIALNPGDAAVLEAEGKRAIYLSIENGYPIGNDLKNVELFYNKGVRYVTLVHSTNNGLADSATDSGGPEHSGISPLGASVVEEMNRLGIMVDVSHGSDDTFYDAIELSKAPIIATHSNARRVTDHPRNMSDNMLRLIAKNRGVVQLTMLSDYLRGAPENPERDSALESLRASLKPSNEMTEGERRSARDQLREIRAQYPDPLATVKNAVDHIDHIVRIAGIDHVGIGCDFDGGGGIDGVFDVSEVMNITIELARRGYSEQDIEKIWSGNILRVFAEVQAVAEDLQSQTL
jgi:membrane dipeptidase